jgi:hypothetical protein
MIGGQGEADRPFLLPNEPSPISITETVSRMNEYLPGDSKALP